MSTTSPFVTVTEAATFLGISRSLAYEQARRYLQTDGQRGLACIRVGHRILVPTASLERLAGLASDSVVLTSDR